MRSTGRMLKVLGVLFLLGGIAAIVWSATSDSPATIGGWSVGITFVIVGVIMMVAARTVGRLDPTETLRDGVAGTAQVTSIQDTGMTVNNLTMVLKARVVVTVPGQPPYEGEMKIPLGRTQWGSIQPGMTLPVKVDPKDLSRIVLDPSRPVTMGATVPGMVGMTGGMAGGLPGGAVPGAAGAMPMTVAPGQQVTTRSAADIIALGVATTGTLQSIEPTGLQAGSVAAGLPADQADDPIMKVTFSYQVPGQTDGAAAVLVRVPDGKIERLVPGGQVPVRYLANEPTTATLDWDRL
jgi:hypothetical protein